MKIFFYIIFLIIMSSSLDAHTGTSLHYHGNEFINVLILVMMFVYSINKIISMEEKND